MAVDVSGPSARLTKGLARALVALCVILAATSITLGVINPAPKSSDWGGTSLPFTILWLGPMLTLAVVGGLIAVRRPKNPVGWFLLAAGLVWQNQGLHDALILHWENHFGHPPPVVDWTALTGWVPAIAFEGTFLLLFFPNGELPSRRWRPVVVLCVVMVLVATPVTALTPVSSGAALPPMPNALRPYAPLAMKLSFVVALVPICIILSLVSLVFRYRRASYDDREKLKWIFFGAFVALAYFITTMLVSVAFDHPGSTLVPLAHFLQSGTFVALAVIPVTIGFAVLRYRLYEIDRIISRTLSYALVTALLAGLYVLVVLVPTSVLERGRGAPPWLVAVGTLAVAAGFTPVRRRVQGAVDHRFNRRRYDAERIIDSFAARLREQVDIDELTAALRGIVGQTVHPAHVGVWLPSEGAPGRRARNGSVTPSQFHKGTR